MRVDLSEFEKLATPSRPPCHAGVTIQGLNVEDRAKFDAAATKFGYEVLTRWLAERGFDGKWQALRTHFNGQCGCPND